MLLEILLATATMASICNAIFSEETPQKDMKSGGKLKKKEVTSDQSKGTPMDMKSKSLNHKIKTSCVEFENIVNCIKNQDISGISEEIRPIALLYSSENDLFSDFNIFIDSSEYSKDEKVTYKEFFKELMPLLKDMIDKNKRGLKEIFDKTLKEINISVEELDERNKTLCDNLTRDLKDDYKDVLKRCQSMFIEAPSEIQSGSSLFTTEISECANIQANTNRSKILVNLIAIWTKNNINLPCLNDKTQEELANDIMDYIDDNQKVNV